MERGFLERAIEKNIIEEYIPLVRYIAARIFIEKNKVIEYEDLVGYGILGLIDAFEKYDKDKGAKFSSYASIRIKGSIIDELRKNRPIPKGAMDKLKKYNIGVEKLRNKLLREPTITEVEKYLNLNKAEAKKIESYINIMAILSLDDNLILKKKEFRITISSIEDKNMKTPEEIYLEEEFKEILKEALGELNGKDRRVLEFYYYNELTLKKIGEILSISESRVCQIHSRALKNLKYILEKKIN